MPTELPIEAMEVEAVLEDDLPNGDVQAATEVTTLGDDEDDEDDEESTALPVDSMDVADEEDDDDDEEVLTAVVVDDDEDMDGSETVDYAVDAVEEVAAAAAAPDVPQAVASKPKPAPKKSDSKPKDKGGAAAKKKRKKKEAIPKSASTEDIYKSLPPQKVEAARDARLMLQETVPTLPVAVGETQVRSFGRLCIHSAPTITPKKNNCKFNTTSALYPIGFSCDRYEFSPVHGRVLQMRCSILDGKLIKAKQKKGGFPVQSELPDGPVFRIMWGVGVDQAAADETEYPFDPSTHSPPLVMTGSSKTDALVKEAVKSKPVLIFPEEGMRVKVRFDKNQYFAGDVTAVGEPRTVTASNGKKKRKQVDVTILYDDGSEEKMAYPDPDIVLLMPGAEVEIGPKGELELTELNRKPVISVVGQSPLETWGKVLTRLGLIDEIMFNRAMESVQNSRSEGLQEAKDKLDGKSQPKAQNCVKKEASGSDAPTPPSPATSAPTSVVSGEFDREEKKEAEEEPNVLQTPDQEPPSAQEKELRAKVEALKAELETAKEVDQKEIIALANARINDHGTFLCNPFHDEESAKSQQASWLTTAVRKEKARMGSTGNKRKVVSALDLLERNDSLYNTDIEALIEGLPGSEFCESYVFQAFRYGASVNRSWIHEAQLRNERDAMQRVKRSRDSQAKDDQEQEKTVKRRKRDDLRDSRKKVKTKEEEEKRKIRVDERLSRLEIQINDRLAKESAFQREKVVVSLARTLAKEFTRRRKAAETLSGQAIVENTVSTASATVVPSFGTDLPVPSKVYHEDTVRVWNFMSTFESFFLERKFVSDIPTLHSLQAAIDCLQGVSSVMATDDAISSLTELSIALCKPLAASLTRSLFASLIALNPALQKDFGAAFFNGVNATSAPKPKDGESEEEVSDRSDALLPVNSMTWQEIARLAFLSDALGELGHSKHDAAHLMRGYRSAGHPNSKESKRLRKAEDFPVALLRQQIAAGLLRDDAKILGRTPARADVPCTPFESASPSATRRPGDWPWSVQRQGSRCGIGQISCLSLSASDLKKLNNKREVYMEDALNLKEEMERQKLKEAAGEDDDDDDEEDEEDHDVKPGASKEASGGVVDESTANGSQSSSEPKTPNGESVGTAAGKEPQKIGKETAYDEFCADLPTAPELIRRCLAVLRTLAVSGPAEPFLYPVDPQTNPGYYDMVIQPMCLREAGNQLYKAATELQTQPSDADAILDNVVVQFGRNIRLIEQNCLTYTNAGPMVIAAGAELVRLFERLFFDWVLAPEHVLPPLDFLDDDRCVEHHASDEESTVLLCDGCEGKYNIFRLEPPLKKIPNGDWYCPRCISGRWYGSVDPRLGKVVKKLRNVGEKTESFGATARIEKCMHCFPSNVSSEATLMYSVKYSTGKEETWSLSEVDEALAFANEHVAPVRCLLAVVESPGYGFGVDAGLRRDVVPAPLNPKISDSSSQVALSSSVFRDTIAASGTLLVIDPRDMTATEWLRLLVLLVMKCSSSDVIQNVVGEMETKAAETMAKSLEKVKKVQVKTIQKILPHISDPDGNYSNGEDFVDDSSRPLAVPVSENGGASPAPAKTSLVAAANKQKDSTIPTAVVVDAGAVEVVSSTEIDTALVPGASSIVETAAVIVEEVLPFAAAKTAKGKRQKAIEDSFAAYVIKNQMKPTVASFDEDNFSWVTDSLLSSKDPGLSFAGLRCRRMTCKFCGLTDVALGSPLVRVPDDAEWEDLMPHCARSRRTHLVAEIESPSQSGPTKLVSVTLRLEGELVSMPEDDLREIKDGGMLEFAPRSELGFQGELQFRYDSGLPFVTGSLSAHECCAYSAHNARKDKMVQKYKENQAALVEKDVGMTCARTLEIGRDGVGRSFWKFFSSPDTLFVCVENDSGTPGVNTATWNHYESPESIASVVVSLGKHPVVKDLLRAFPIAHQMIRDGSWTDKLLKGAFPHVAKLLTGEGAAEKALSKAPVQEVEGGYEPYRVGEHVLVESKSGHMLWDASVAAVSKRPVNASGNEIIDAYRVTYKKWGSRFVEWVKPSRVVEPNEHNRLLQEELLEDRTVASYGLPKTLHQMYAKEYLMAEARARGSAHLPDFARIASPAGTNPSTSEITFATSKAALLAIESALPMGGINTRESGPWRAEYARQWRLIVVKAEGPAALMQCVIALEDRILEDWIKEDVGHLRSCLPARWKAVAEATPSSLALRILLLDRSVIYANVDKKRFAKKKKR